MARRICSRQQGSRRSRAVRLIRFSVRNYRSIKSTPRINVDQNLTIIGPNNEGKSNIVRALVAALRILEEHGESRRSIGIGGIALRPLSNPARHLRRESSYDWTSDCHVGLQNVDGASTSFYLEFQLSDLDVSEFYKDINSTINGFLPIEIHIDRLNVPYFEVKKQGKAKAFLQERSAEVARFVGKRLSINHIPAVRTADEAIAAVSALASTSLRRVQNHPDYQEALATIERIHKPLYEELELQLSQSLQRFLPSIRDVTLDITASSISRALRSVDIFIDDGQVTSLRNKGDGVISLVGMALLARLRESTGSTFNTILAIEEPESHLHPRAIHSIREILDNIGADYQVIVTTHSPVLADRLNLQSNVIVQNSQARVATDISEIREALGVRVSDNLSHARIVIVCEGPGDEIGLKKLICELSPSLENALRSAEISFYPLSGSGNLSYVISMLQQSISEPVCFLDDDMSGRKAVELAQNDQLITNDDVILTSVLGKTEAEFEDLIDTKIVNDAILARFKVDVGQAPVSTRKLKFSKRCQLAFQADGYNWNDSTKAQVKNLVSEIVSKNGASAIGSNCRGPIERLVRVLEAMI
jgi:putative ATP-dependent endonuclease of the OLD family